MKMYIGHKTIIQYFSFPSPRRLNSGSSAYLARLGSVISKTNTITVDLGFTLQFDDRAEAYALLRLSWFYKEAAHEP